MKEIFFYFCPENLWCPTQGNIFSLQFVLFFLKSSSNFLEWGSNPQKYYIFRAGIENYFLRFSVQMKTAESHFKIIWPLSWIEMCSKRNLLKLEYALNGNCSIWNLLKMKSAQNGMWNANKMIKMEFVNCWHWKLQCKPKALERLLGWIWPCSH